MVPIKQTDQSIMLNANTLESEVDGNQQSNDKNQQNIQDEYEFDESNPIQLKSKRFTSQRRRGVYGTRGTRGYGRHRRNSSNDECGSISSAKRKPSTQIDELPKPFIDIRPSNSYKNDFGSKKSALRGLSSDSSEKCDSNENAHPNSNSRDLSTFLSTGSSTSFSSLSRSGNFSKHGRSLSMSSSSKLFQSFPESGGDLSFSASYLSPPRHSDSLSRKRGVCDSPIALVDDQSSTAGISISRNSTSSYGSRRARSRIFSPDSTKKIMEAALAPNVREISHPLRKKHEDSFNESDSDHDEDGDVDGEDYTSMILSTSMNEADDRDHPEASHRAGVLSQLPPNMLKRTASINSGTFESAIFANENNNAKGIRANDHFHVFETMSSYEDLKFLIRELRKYNSGRQIGFGSMRKVCTVVPPKHWGHLRKLKFNSWATSHLGFCYRSGGGMVSYLQTTQSKGHKALKMLEAAILSYKASSKNEIPKPSTSLNLPLAPMSSIKIVCRPSLTPMLPNLKSSSIRTPMLPSVRSTISRNYRNNTPMSVDKKSPSCNIVGNIMDKLVSMDIQDVAKMEKKIHVVGPRDKSVDSGSGTSPLTRMVTLSTDDNINIASGRPSYESSVMNNGDFMSEMHGISPVFTKSNNLRPSTLAVSGLKKFNIISTMSPCVQPVDFEGVETPMLKSGFHHWGSRPIAGKDWGDSTRCDDTVIRILVTKMEEGIAMLRNQGSCAYSCGSILHGTHNVHPEISAIRADSTMLGFDNEVESYCSAAYSSEDENIDVSDDELCNENMTSFSALDLNEGVLPSKESKRREKSMAKRNRMSICESAMASPRPFCLSLVNSRKSFAYCESTTLPSIDKLQSLKEVATLTLQKEERFEELQQSDPCAEVCSTHKLLLFIFSHLSEYDLLCTASLVSSQWSDAVTDAHASLMLMSVGCPVSFAHSDNGRLRNSESHFLDDGDSASIEENNEIPILENKSIIDSMMRSWSHIVDKFPWGVFLSEGSFKRVYKVWNSSVRAEEAVSVMDINRIDNVNIVGAELAVSVMLSSMARRKICPNFVLVRGVFTSKFEPSVSLWGSADKKSPLGKCYDESREYPRPKMPSVEKQDSFQYIRMELCRHGDVEEYIKRQPDCILPPDDARSILFQMAFSLHVAGNRFGMKHYDVKLLNFFLDKANDDLVDENEHPFTVLRYGLGSHVFNLRMHTSAAVLAKLADFGTANVGAECDGQPVIIGNFTTLENTPADYMILGDSAVQGYGHDCFGLGLCMLHLFTGHAPYEEILDTVTCPPNLRKKLRNIWENKTSNGYEVIRSVILSDVFEDEDGFVEGEPDETLYDTLYRFLVLFGIPKDKFQWKEGSRIWRAIDLCLGSDDISSNASTARRSRRNVANVPAQRRKGLDSVQYHYDCKKFSIFSGENEYIAGARKRIQRFNGGMDLLLSLVSFDPKERLSPLDVMNSTFMEPLREGEGVGKCLDTDIVYSYMSYSL